VLIYLVVLIYIVVNFDWYKMLMFAWILWILTLNLQQFKFY